MPPRKKAQPEEKLCVRITIEYVGHVRSGDLMAFHSGLGSTLDNHLENGGGGHEVGTAHPKSFKALAKR